MENGAFLLRDESGMLDPAEQVLDEMLSFSLGKRRALWCGRCGRPLTYLPRTSILLV